MPFSSIIGHGAVIELLKHAAARQRVPQSLIFAGPEGVGKRAVAIALAQAVNCPNRRNGDACGACPTCSRIARRQHSDVTVIEKGEDASIKIRTIRERLLETVNYRPFEAERKVYIIEPADEMTLEAQDAMLKTLEEPPSAAILILVTAFPDTLLATIRSRCRKLRFGWLTETDVARILVEREQLKPAAAAGLAAASGGSVARALAEQSGAFEDDREAALNLLQAARHKALPPRLKAGAALAQHGTKRRDREALSERFSILLSLIRDLGALAANGPVPLANNDVAESLGELASSFSLDRVTGAFDQVEKATQYLERNASPKILADWLAVTI